jgi:2-amino-4-hydroxy-6-hydroxymethyldihydropteridine diphosphokinase
MAKVYLSLGSNIGNRQANLAKAVAEIGRRIGAYCSSSGVYETGAWGFDSANFLNQVIFIETRLSPQSLIALCLEIEKEMGRTRNSDKGYASRVIDIDILFYNDLILNVENLIIPHPHIQDRRFILIPLHDIASSLRHPVLNKTVSELLAECSDEGMVTVFHE